MNRHRKALAQRHGQPIDQSIDQHDAGTTAAKAVCPQWCASRGGRVDCLLYCHDGKGLGHVSRSIAIGLALRRLRPSCRVALATGAAEISELTGNVPIGHLSLPPYAALNKEPPQIAMGKRRARILEAAMRRISPSVVIVDQLCCGEQNELRGAIECGVSQGTKFLFGVRGIVGESSTFWSQESRRFVNRFYDGLLWYGSTNYYGEETKAEIARHSRVPLHETGIVSRAVELDHHGELTRCDEKEDHAVIVISWANQASFQVLRNLLEVFPSVPSIKQWHIFMGPVRDGSDPDALLRECIKNPRVSLHQFSVNNLNLLRSARVAITYAGYNSTSDLFWAQTPAILLTRTGTREQQLNAATACSRSNGGIAYLREETAGASELRELLLRQIDAPNPVIQDEVLSGAEVAARQVLNLLVCRFKRKTEAKNSNAPHGDST